MKNKPKSKSKSPALDNQLSLDYLLDRLIKLADVVELQVKRVDKRIDVLLTEGIGKPVEPKRPTLKWFEQEPQLIEWWVCCDPATLILASGTTMRYNLRDEQVTTYDGVRVGDLNVVGHEIIREATNRGDKVHVYLTTARKLGIKLGRPA